MRAAVFEGEGRLVVKDVPDPVPGPDEVLIEVEACGVCGSDVQIINVPPGPPVDARRSSSATSSSAGSGRSARPSATSPIGGRVVCDPDPKCGACDSCRAGRPANCTNIVALGVHRDGALARVRDRPGEQRLPDLRCRSGGAGRARRAAGLRRQRHEPGGHPTGRVGRRVRGRGDRLPVHRRLPGVGRGEDRRRSSRARTARPVAKAVGADVVLTPDEWAAQSDRAACRPAPTWSSMRSAASCRRRSKRPGWAPGSSSSA